VTADEIRRLLDLAPHPEGGFYRETWRAAEALPAAALPARYGGGRAAGTAIYYLLTPGTFSTLHRLRSDEVFHCYAGDPVELLLLAPGGAGEVVTLGSDLGAGHRPQQLVPAGVWQGARLRAGGAWALLGCTVAPGFDFADYEAGGRADLQRGWPAFAALIGALTREAAAP
jgi:uncharacterized protein